jgi:DNA-binding MurR/RpiR family transcriptional regulator
MRISRQEGNHIVCLTDAEASAVVEACALMVLAVESDPRISMPPQMGTVLCELFEGLKSEVGAKTC